MDDKTSMFLKRVSQEPLIADKFMSYDSTFSKILLAINEQNDKIMWLTKQMTMLETENKKILGNMKEISELIERVSTTTKQADESKPINNELENTNNEEIQSIKEQIIYLKSLVNKMDDRLFKRGI